MTDRGLTHVALCVADLDASVAFWTRFADMVVVHDRVDDSRRVVWLSDLTRPFVVVLIAAEVTHELGGWTHLGVACPDREDVDRRCAEARAAGVVVEGPFDDGPPVGYWAILTDPDGHHLELAHGQDVEDAVVAARAARRLAGPDHPDGR